MLFIKATMNPFLGRDERFGFGFSKRVLLELRKSHLFSSFFLNFNCQNLNFHNLIMNEPEFHCYRIRLTIRARFKVSTSKGSDE